MKDDRVYLLHILECIRRIEEDTAGGRSIFFSSRTLQDAVLEKPANTGGVHPATFGRHKDAIIPKSNGDALPRFATYSSMTTSASTWRESGRSPNAMCPN